MLLPRRLDDGGHVHGVPTPGEAPGEEADDTLEAALLPWSDELEDRQTLGH